MFYSNFNKDRAAKRYVHVDWKYDGNIPCSHLANAYEPATALLPFRPLPVTV